MQLINGTIGTFFGNLRNMDALGLALFGPISMTPAQSWLGIINLFFTQRPVPIGLIILYLGAIITPLSASIMAGNLSDTKGSAFGCWFLVAITCAIGFLVMAVIGGPRPLLSMINIIMIGVINGFFYGCFALLKQTEF